MKTILENLSLEKDADRIGYDPFSSQYKMDINESISPQSFDRTVTIKQRLLLSITQVVTEASYLYKDEPLTYSIEKGKSHLLSKVYEDMRPVLNLLRGGILSRNLQRIEEAERILSMFVNGDVNAINSYKIPYESIT